MNTPKLSTFEHALSFLNQREHSTKEITQKLKSKGHPEQDIAETIERLYEYNYLNDHRFAELFVRGRISKPYGKNRINQELAQKGITSDIIRKVLNDTDTDWFELAKQAKVKRFGIEICSDYKEKSKQSRYLQYRGFSFDEIHYALSEQNEY